MSEGKSRRMHMAEFKGKVGLEAVPGVKTVTEIAQEFGVHPVLVGQRKKGNSGECGKLVRYQNVAPSRLMKAAPRTSCTARSGG